MERDEDAKERVREAVLVRRVAAPAAALRVELAAATPADDPLAAAAGAQERRARAVDLSMTDYAAS